MSSNSCINIIKKLLIEQKKKKYSFLKENAFDKKNLKDNGLFMKNEGI